MRRAARELWEISKIWWLIVPGGALGAVAIVQAIKGSPGKSVWFWGFWAMTAVAFALAWRLRRVVHERDQAIQDLEAEHSAEATARRLGELADEAVLIREEIPDGNDWGDVGPAQIVTTLEHWQARVESEIRRYAKEHLDYWRENPDWLETNTFLTPEVCRRFVDYKVARARHVASELGK